MDLTLTLTDEEVAAVRLQATSDKEATADLIVRLLRQQFVKPAEQRQRVKRVQSVLEKIANLSPEKIVAVNQAIDELERMPVTVGIVGP